MAGKSGFRFGMKIAVISAQAMNRPGDDEQRHLAGGRDREEHGRGRYHGAADGIAGEARRASAV